MTHRLFLAVILWQFMIQINLAQNVLGDYQDFFNKAVKSPTPFEFTNYSSKGNVDLSTGKFGLNVPFYTISNQFIELPVGLSYSTSGVKVDQLSSEIGIDWNLYGGGAVTRILKGYPDEMRSLFIPCVASVPSCSGSYGKNVFSGKVVNKVGGNFSVLNLYRNYNILNGGYPFTGSAVQPRTEFFLTQFPNIDYPTNTIQDGYYWTKTNNELEAILLTKNYKAQAAGKAGGDNERDIFKVNVGSLSFHFMLKIKEEHVGENDNNPVLVEDYFEAIPLDHKGVKIDFRMDYQKPVWNEWSSDNTTRNRITRGSGIITGFTITTTNGVKYIFDKYELTEHEYIKEMFDRTSSGVNNQRTMQFSLEDVYTSSWKITKIILPNTQTVNFSYQDNHYSYPFTVPRQHDGEYKGFGHNNAPALFSNSINSLDHRVFGHALREIKLPANQGKISFEYIEDRRDIEGGLRMTKIKLFDKFNKMIKETSLRGVYVKSSSVTSSIDPKSWRLYLGEIIDSEKKNSYKLHYYKKEDLGSRGRIHSQDIYGYYLGEKHQNISSPAYPKFYIIANQREGKRICYDKPYDFDSDDVYYIFSGLDRSVNSATVDYGVLHQVDFVTGGKLMIDYESNTYFNESSYRPNALGPGVRVKNLNYYTTKSQALPNLTKSYSYNHFISTSRSSGVRLCKPSFAYTVNLAMDNEKNWGVEQTKISNVWPYHNRYFNYFVSQKELYDKGLSRQKTYKKLTRISTHSIGATSDVFGREMLYTNVKEEQINPNTNTNSGYSNYTFHYFDNRSEVNVISGPTDDSVYLPTGTKETGFGAIGKPWDLLTSSNGAAVSYGLVEKRGYDIYPFPDRNYFGLDNSRFNGELKIREDFTSDQKIVKKVAYKYKKYIEEDKVAYTLKNVKTGYMDTHVYRKGDQTKKRVHFLDIPAYEYSGLHFFDEKEYYFDSPFVLTQVNTTEYNNGKEINYLKKYDYDNYAQVSNETIKNSDGINTLVNYIYPYNTNAISYSNNPSGINLLRSQNRIAIPIGKETSSNSLVEYEFTQYQNHLNRISVPSSIQTSKNNSSLLEDRVIYNRYDTVDDISKPVEVSKVDGSLITYVWGYEGVLPIAKIEHASYDQVSSFVDDLKTKSNADNDRTQGYTGKEGALRQALDNLRDALPNAMVTTYTYDPLIGMTSMTDPKGYTIYYTYDPENRLDEIKDAEGHLISKNQYHYKNQ